MCLKLTSILKALFKQKHALCVLHLDYPYNLSPRLCISRTNSNFNEKKNRESRFISTENHGGLKQYLYTLLAF